MGKTSGPALYQSNLHSLPLLGRGKVRDNYAVGDDRLLIVTSDRLSAFDVVMSEPIPDKGKVLNQMSQFWFDMLADVVPNHLTGVAPETVVASDELDQVRGRSMVVKRLQPILVEAVVRGYVIGSGWKDYQASGAICGIKLPPGWSRRNSCPSRSSRRLPRPTSASMTRTSASRKPVRVSAVSLLAGSARSVWSCIGGLASMQPVAASSSPTPSSSSDSMRAARCI